MLVAVSVYSQLFARDYTAAEGDERGTVACCLLYASQRSMQKNLYLLEREAEFYHLDVLCGLIAKERGMCSSVALFCDLRCKIVLIIASM